VLFSTHLIDDAERICDRVCMIAGARKVLDGTLAEVRAESGRKDVTIVFDGDRGWLGHPAVESVTDHGRRAEIRLREGADPQGLLRAAVAAEAKIERFEIAEPSLREIFLERAGARGLPATDIEAARAEAESLLEGEAKAGAPAEEVS
jgi:ABC-2 type transport system ATP-binding protein